MNPIASVQRPRSSTSAGASSSRPKFRASLRRSQTSGRAGCSDPRAHRAEALGGRGAALAREPRRWNAARRGVEVGGGGAPDRAPTSLVDTLAEQFTSSPYRSDEDFVFLPSETRIEARGRVVSGQVPGGSRRSRCRGQDPRLPRHAPHGADEPRGDGCEPDRGHGDGRSSLYTDDEGLPAPGRRRLPRGASALERRLLGVQDSGTKSPESAPLSGNA